MLCTDKAGTKGHETAQYAAKYGHISGVKEGQAINVETSVAIQLSTKLDAITQVCTCLLRSRQAAENAECAQSLTTTVSAR
jgi:hypothetical protein